MSEDEPTNKICLLLSYILESELDEFLLCYISFFDTKFAREIFFDCFLDNCFTVPTIL